MYLYATSECVITPGPTYSPNVPYTIPKYPTVSVHSIQTYHYIISDCTIK